MTKRFSCHELIQIVALTSSLNCSLKKTSAAAGAAQVAARTAGNANFILKTVETFVLLFVIGFDFKKDERLDALCAERAKIEEALNSPPPSSIETLRNSCHSPGFSNIPRGTFSALLCQ